MAAVRIAPVKPLSKSDVLEAIRAAIAREIAVLDLSAASAREGATHEQAKPENDKDTRALEASYLAGAQAGRARDLAATAKRIEFLELRDFGKGDPIAPSALVELDVDGVRSVFFLADVGGGRKVEVGGVEVQVVTAEAPLGQALLGKKQGDTFEMRVKKDVREYEIVGVR